MDVRARFQNVNGRLVMIIETPADYNASLIDEIQVNPDRLNGRNFRKVLD